MVNHQMTLPGHSPCEMRWVSVQDPPGRQRLEARWTAPGSTAALAEKPAA